MAKKTAKLTQRKIALNIVPPCQAWPARSCGSGSRACLHRLRGLYRGINKLYPANIRAWADYSMTGHWQLGVVMDATSRRTRNKIAENQDSGLNGRLQPRDFTPLRELISLQTANCWTKYCSGIGSTPNKSFLPPTSITT